MTYTYTVTNTGTGDLTRVAVIDGKVGTPYGAFWCIDEFYVLPAGQTVECTASFTIVWPSPYFDATGTMYDPVGAWGILLSDESVSAYYTNTVTVTLRQFAPVLSVSLQKTADPIEIHAGDPVTYTFKVTNDGDVALSGIQVDDVDFGADGTFYCQGDANKDYVLPPGESIVCDTLTVPIPASMFTDGSFTNSAAAIAVSADDGTSVMSPWTSATVTLIPEPVIPEPVTGQDFTASTLMNQKLPGLGVIGAVGTPNRDLLDGRGIDESTCTVDYSAPANGLVDKNATTEWLFDYTPNLDFVGVDVFDYSITCGTTVVNGTYTVTVTEPPFVPAPGIQLSKSVTPTQLVDPGEVEYTFTVANTGNTSLSDIKIDDPLLSAAPIACGNATKLDPGDSPVTCKVTYLVTAADLASGSFTNTATAIAGSTEPAGGDYFENVRSNKAQATVSKATVLDLGAAIDLSAGVDPTSVVAGKSAVFTYTITNTGAVRLTGLEFTDWQFDGQGSWPGAADVSCAKDGAAFHLAGDSLAPGEVLVCSVTYETVSKDAPGDVTSLAQVTGQVVAPTCQTPCAYPQEAVSGTAEAVLKVKAPQQPPAPKPAQPSTTKVVTGGHVVADHAPIAMLVSLLVAITAAGVLMRRRLHTA